MMMTIQTEYNEMVSKPSTELKSELANEKIERKKMNIYTARGAQ